MTPKDIKYLVALGLSAAFLAGATITCIIYAIWSWLT